MVYTPVGARCPACARLQRVPTYNVALSQYPIAILVGIGGALVSGFLWAILPLGGFLAFFVALGIGYGLGEVISLSVNRKRGLGLQIVAGFSFFASYLVSRVFPLLLLLVSGGTSGSSLSAAILGAVVSSLLNPFALLLLVLVVAIAVTRLR